MTLIDRYGREISYLRISVTDRCNMRCVYCMPPEGVPYVDHSEIMRYEEIAAVVRVAAENGIRSVRITGGEPLVRGNLQALIGMIREVPQIEDISLTTNGLLLEEMAAPLAQAGLNRINISMDTLDPEKFSRITRGGSLEKMWRGVEAAEGAGLGPIKFNTVAMRGVNDDEIVNLAMLSMKHPWDIRFIEIMPVKNQETWGPGFPPPEDTFIPVQEMRARLESYGLHPVAKKTGRGPAREYYLDGAMGKIGFISPLGEHFCGECNRLRLTSDGNLRPCLLSDFEIPLLPALRRGEDILPILQRAVQGKPLGHELRLNHTPEARCMRQIGG